MKKSVIPIHHHAQTRSLTWRGLQVSHLHQAIIAAVIFGIGFAPIAALALALMDVITLPLASILLVIPAIVIALGLSCCHAGCGRLMLHGYWMGMIAVAVYDCVRIPFTMAGWMDDFIPKIGILLVGNSEHHAFVGYLWRYLGNGGGMGMAFVCAVCLLKPGILMLRELGDLKSGLLFGFFVWACLIATIKIAPRGEDTLFLIAPVGLVLSLIGHLVFGGTLGCLLKHLRPEVANDAGSFGFHGLKRNSAEPSIP